LPIFAHADADPYRRIYSAESFAEWYRKPDAASVNLILKEGADFDDGLSYGFHMDDYYPYTGILKDIGWDRNRFCFTTELHAKLAYDVSAGSENPTRLLFRSDDDCWIFVNGRLVSEWVGLSGGSGEFLLRNTDHGLEEETGVCDLAIFHAERLRENAVLKFMTSTALIPVYSYQVVVDTRAGSPVQFSLGSGAPAGMTIDPSSGKLLWDYSSLTVGTYSATVRVTDNFQNSDSQTIEVLIGVKPVFTLHPGSSDGPLFVPMGGSVVLTAEANGTPAPSYQWYYSDQPIPGATSATLTLDNVDYSNSGLYRVRASNIIGASTSKNAQIYVYE
jgi:fibro-slime domain-containing protein